VATNPSFIATPVIGLGSLTTGQTARTTGTTAEMVTVLTAGSTGTRVLEVVVKADDDPADSVVCLWLHDGTNATIFDEIDVGNPSAASTTSPSYRSTVTYSNLVLPNGWSLRATCTVTPTSGSIKVFALGGNL